MLSQHDLDWFAARLLIAVKDTNDEFRKQYMGIVHIKQALAHVPGIDSLTMQYGDKGAQVFKWGDMSVEVPANSSEAVVSAAISTAASAPVPISAGEVTPVTTAATVVATPLPAAPSPVGAAPSPVGAAPSTPPVAKPASGSFSASIKAMMDEARAGVAQARADGLVQVKDAVGKLNDAKTATAKVAGTMAKTIEDEAASVLSELGQISNDLG